MAYGHRQQENIYLISNYNYSYNNNKNNKRHVNFFKNKNGLKQMIIFNG